jgi:hypothetical protein
MLPENVKKILIENKNLSFSQYFKPDGTLYDNITKEDYEWFCKKLNICNKKSSIVDFYTIVAFPPLGKGDELFTLDQIIENYENSFWADEYPNITDRYLQLSSIEGEGSYFYDKETDAVYSVDWSEMDDFMAGKLQPTWKSFYDFLEWYYGDNEE